MTRLPQPDGFVLAMLGAVVAAALYAPLGTSTGPLHLAQITGAGVALVFFFSGAALSPASLRAGAANWRLHLFVQLCTYGLFPLLGAALGTFARPWLAADMLTGFFYLCALSSTISSSIAMTSLARGNVAGAIFNATLSSLLGMAMTPLLMSLWLQHSGHGAPLSEQMLNILRQLLLPFVLGQALRPWFGQWLARHRALSSRLDRAVIVLIVYNAFCDATAAGLWQRYGWAALAQTFLLCALLLAGVLTLTTRLARRLRLPVEDEIAAVFCGSKKSVATGIPMAKLLFGNDSTLGMIVLPIMLYHQLQLFVCALLAQRYAARDSAPGVKP